MDREALISAVLPAIMKGRREPTRFAAIDTAREIADALLTRTEATTGAGERLREAARWLVDRASHHGSHAAIDQDHIDALRDAVNEYDAALAQPAPEERAENDSRIRLNRLLADYPCGSPLLDAACDEIERLRATQPVQDEGAVIQADQAEPVRFAEQVASEVQAFALGLHHSTMERHHLDRSTLALWGLLRHVRRAFSRERGDA